MYFVYASCQRSRWTYLHQHSSCGKQTAVSPTEDAAPPPQDGFFIPKLWWSWSWRTIWRWQTEKQTLTGHCASAATMFVFWYGFKFQVFVPVAPFSFWYLQQWINKFVLPLSKKTEDATSLSHVDGIYIHIFFGLVCLVVVFFFFFRFMSLYFLFVFLSEQ